jgi:predicted chitinase
MRAKDFILKETGAPKRGDQDPIGDLVNRLSNTNTTTARNTPRSDNMTGTPKNGRPAGTPPIHVSLEPVGLGAYIEKKAKADGIKGVQLANFMAQSKVETAGFTALEEWADGSAYEGKKILGNIYKGDGPKFKGRGFMHLTGRENYTKCADAITSCKNIVKNPELVATDKTIAADSALWFWNTFIRKNYRANDIQGVSERVNGGTNGLTERIAAFKTYIAKLKKGIPDSLKNKRASADIESDADQYVASVDMPDELAEQGKASRSLCTGGKPDHELGASQLASCKSQGLRARDGEKSHLITAGKRNVRVTVGGKKIKGKKYGGPLPDYGTRKNQR